MKKCLKRVWCSYCVDKKPPEITEAVFLVPVRDKHYGLIPGTVRIDKRVCGVCEKCLKELSEFKRTYAQDMNKNHPNLVYTKQG